MSESKLLSERENLVHRVIDSEEFAESYSIYGNPSIGARNLGRLASSSFIDLEESLSSPEDLHVPVWPMLRSRFDIIGRSVRITRLLAGYHVTRDLFFEPDQVSIDGEKVILRPVDRPEISTTVYDPTLITVAGFAKLQDMGRVGSGHTSSSGLYWRVALLTARHSQYNESEYTTGVVSLARKNGVMLSPFAKSIKGLAEFRAQPEKVRTRLNKRR